MTGREPGVAFLPNEAIQRLAEQLGTPFFLYDEAGIRTAAREFLAPFQWARGFHQTFPVAATPNPAILSILREEGIGALCTSPAEVALAHMAGYDDSELDYLATNTVMTDFSGFRSVIVDDPFLLRFLQFPNTVALRWNPGGKFYIDEQASARLARVKSGMALRDLRMAAQALHTRGVEQLGLSAQFVNTSNEPGYYAVLAETLLGLRQDIRKHTGVNMNFCHLGGDLEIRYQIRDTDPDVEEASERLRKCYEEKGAMELGLTTEAARCLTGHHAILVAEVLTVKDLAQKFVQVNCSTADLLRPALTKGFHKITVLNPGPDIGGAYHVVGDLPELGDRFADRRPLPDVVPGSLLVFHDTGCYAKSRNILRAHPPEYLLRQDNTIVCIRRRETVEELLAPLTALPDDVIRLI